MCRAAFNLSKGLYFCFKAISNFLKINSASLKVFQGFSVRYYVSLLRYYASPYTNPTTALGELGSDYTDATVQLFTGFDWTDYEGNAKTGEVNLGEWTYPDGSGSASDAMVQLRKVTVPEGVYVFMTSAEMGVNTFATTNDNYPIDDLYTIFDSDPSANILQVVE